MKVLVTGFDPFGGEKINPAYEAVKLLPSKIKEARVIKKMLPTVFRESLNVLYQAIEDEAPDIVICVGQSGGRTHLSLECIGINKSHSQSKDNKGYIANNEAIFHDGADGYFSTLPIYAIVDKLKAQKIPALVSYSAGTYVCNHVFYGLMYYIRHKCPHIKGGFIHVPYIPEQVLNKKKAPHMPLKMIRDGLKYAIEEAVDALLDVVD